MAVASLPLRPPLAPMLARLVRELPIGDYVYEPKWDGFRAIIFRDGDEVDIQSRHERPMARYFPELVAAVRMLPVERIVVDGEIIVVRDGQFDFAALMLRTHPAPTRVLQLSAAAPATFIGFDLLLADDDDLRTTPFAERRRRLVPLLEGATGRVVLTPATDDRSEAERWLSHFTGGGVDGVVAKHRSMRYEPGRRAMLKVKVERTADCVVAGFRAFPGGELASLLLGLYDEGGVLRHVGVCSAFSRARRRELFEELIGVAAPLEGHPWEFGFGLEGSPVGRLKGSAGRWDPGMSMDWMPITPVVVEVAYDTIDGRRLRHPAHFRRWRPDREPRSCTFDQLATTPADAAALLQEDIRSGA
jgi:ATP-dependent DNA ligase